MPGRDARQPRACPLEFLYGFLGVLGLLLGAGLIVVAASTRRDLARGRPSGPALVLGLAMGQGLLLVRLLSWPALYWVLGSYIPLIPGAMCLYGVTQAAPGLVHGLEILEPVALLVAGAVFLVLAAYRAGGRGVTAGAVAGHLMAAGVVSVAGSLMGLAFLGIPKGAHEISCCSVVFDTPDRFSLMASGLIVGSDVARLLLPLARSLALALLCFQVWWLLAPRPLISLLVVVLPPLHLALAVLALFETVAPVLTGMEGHHCAYCLGNPALVPPVASAAGILSLGLATFIPLWQAWSRSLSGPATTPVHGPGLWTALSLGSLILFHGLVAAGMALRTG